MKTPFLSSFNFYRPARLEDARKRLAQFLVLALVLIWSANGAVLCCNALHAFSTDGHSPLVMAAAGGSHDHHAGQPDGDHDSHDIDSGAPPSHCLQLTDLGIASPSAIAPTFSKLQMPDAVIIPHHEAVQINLRRNLLSFAIYHPPPRPSYFLRSSRLLI